MPTPRRDPARVQTSTERAARSRRALAEREELYARALIAVCQADTRQEAVDLAFAALQRTGKAGASV